MMRSINSWNSFLRIGIFVLLLSWGHGECLMAGSGSEKDSAAVKREWVAPPSLSSTMLRLGSDTLILPADSTLWRALFAQLDSLRQGKDTVISIVQLGDSHIQAGYQSGMLMRLFHKDFGNAGRGWISPLKLCRTNEPDDYFIRSSLKNWIYARATQRKKKTSIGPGGVGLYANVSAIDMDLIVTPKNGAGYAFNEVWLFQGSHARPFEPTTKWKKAVSVSRSDTAICGVAVDTFRINRLTDTLNLRTVKNPDTSFRNQYFGFSLLNGNPGVLYHSIGINGAMYVNYTSEEYVCRLAALRPALLIVSLGTNESFGRRFSKTEFASQVEAYITLVKRHMPGTALLLTTPPECYRRVTVNKKRTYVRNDNTEKVAEVIREVAKREGLACWDLFTATGGLNSSKAWQRAGLMRNDRIHFVKEGYFEQGRMLYRAFLNTYNNFR